MASSPESPAPQPKPFRRLFRTFLGILLAIYLLALYDVWLETLKDTRVQLAHQAATLAQGTRATLKQHEWILRGLGGELLAMGALEFPERGRALIERMRRIDTGMAGFGLARPDGQLLLVSMVGPHQPLPNLTEHPETADSFKLTVARNALVLGRPYFLRILDTWVVPIRVPLNTPDGRIAAVMTAGYAPETKNTTAWGRPGLPPGTESVILRERDHYLIHLAPIPADMSLNKVYGQPISPDTQAQLRQHPGPNGFARMYLPRRHGTFYVAFQRIPEHELVVGVFKPASAVVQAWLKRLLAPTLVLALFMLTARLFYTRAEARHRQARQETEQAIAELNFLARHDALTQLANRTLFNERLLQHLASGGPLALLLLDLDRFKEINDTLGHPIGDAILCEIAPRLTSALAGQEHVVARLGGDEFALLLPGPADPARLRQIAKRVLANLATPFQVEHMRLELGASIGIALAPRDGQSPPDLLRAADVAMYLAKRKGTRVEFYDSSTDDHSPQRLALMAELGQAIETGQLEIHYQPKMELASGQAWGMEALVRWRHPRLGLVFPDAFLPFAEISDVIHPLTREVLRQSLAARRDWQQRHGLSLSVAVNLSARNLMDDRCLGTIRGLLDEHATPPGGLTLEITETALMHDPEHAARLLRDIAALGVHLAIDDFGTGYSSLSYLRRLPISELKIDRVFVMDMLNNDQDAIIVRSTIGLAHNLGMQVVAEGVEDAATQAMLAEMGCDRIQGYHYARPLNPEALEAWLSSLPRPHP